MIMSRSFPENSAINPQIEKILLGFSQVKDEIDSQGDNSGLHSNKVLELLRPHLLNAGMQVEAGKKKDQRIRIPVLLGLNNEEEKYFEPDAISEDGKIILEVEAGRAIDNNQFIMDIFKACMIEGVEYLVIAVRKSYRHHDDFAKVCVYLRTLYASKRIKLPLNGVTIIGY